MVFFWMGSWVVRNSETLSLWSPWSWMTSPISASLTMVPLQAKSFLSALRMRFWSNSVGRPWTVVRVFRPLRCWIRMSVGG